MGDSKKRAAEQDTERSTKRLRPTQDRVERHHGVRVTAEPKTRAQAAAKQDMNDAKLTAKVTEHNAKRPVKLVSGGKEIWRGGRIDFSTSFRTGYWNKMKNTPCSCTDKACPGKPAIPDGSRDIDHKMNWHDWFVKKCDAYKVCTEEAHWNVYLTADLREANEDYSNLQPMHASCNRSKSGPKDRDAFQPEFEEACPGETCRVSAKATIR